MTIRSQFEILVKVLEDNDLDVSLQKSIKSADKLDKSLKRVEKSTGSIGGKALGSLKKGFDGVVRSVFSLQGLIAGLGTALAFRELIQSANAQEDAIVRLNAALKSSGSFSEEASKELQEFASELQRTSKFGDEVVLNQLALAKSFGATNEQAKQVVLAAADLSAEFGIDLQSATRNVAKTLGGFAGELGETIPSLKELGTEALQAGAGIDLIANRFRGSALNSLNTFSGATAQLSNTFGDLLEQFGFVITENRNVTKGIKVLNTGFDNLKRIVEENRKVLEDIATSGFIILVKTVGLLSKGLIFLIDKIDQARAAWNNFFNQGIIKDLEKQLKVIERQTSGIDRNGKAVESFAATAVKAQLKQLRGETELNEKTRQERKKTFDEFINQINEIEKQISEKGQQEITTKAKVDIELEKDSDGTFSLKADLQKTLDANFGKQLGSILNAALTNVGSALASGAQGPQKLATSITSAIADSFLPGLGGAVGPIIDLLAQGPEQTKATVQAFVENIPVLIENIVDSIPVLIETVIISLAENIDKIALALALAMPKVAAGLASAMPRVAISLAREMPSAAIKFVEGLIKEAPKIVEGIIDGLKEGVKGIFDGVGNVFDSDKGGPLGFVGDAVGGITSALGFAEGGLVPSGFNNDTFPARLSSGEFVVNNSLTPRLEEFLANNQQGVQTSLLAAILEKLNEPVRSNAVIQIDQRTFGNLILELNRNNLRLS